MKAKLYKIHRVLSLVIFVPVILWSLSGILHPIMANWFRVSPAQKTGITEMHSADSSRIAIQDLCLQNNINKAENIGLTYLEQEEVYQIKQNGIISYYAAHSGNEIENGDELYAIKLARHYSGDSKAPISSIEKIKTYTDEYKIINRHLPVYKVSFDRSDGLEVYVHTESGGLGTISNNSRNVFLWCFSMFHNWNFLGSNQTFKSTIILLFSILVFFNGILGLVVYWKNRKAFRMQKKGNDKLKPRKRHRKFSLFASIFLLAFSFSGGYHTIQKFDYVLLNNLVPQTSYNINEYNFSIDEIINDCGPIAKLSLAELNNDPYLRVKDTSATNQFAYYNLNSKMWLENGDEKYAIERTLELSGFNEDDVKSTEFITHYTKAYGFINKRLPVYAVNLNSDDNLTYYIETSTGIPGAVQSDGGKLEVLSFLFLHKYHFLDFMGKGWRDLISSIASFSLVIISLTGFIIWLRANRRKKIK